MEHPAWFVAGLRRAILLASMSCDPSDSIECGCFKRSSYILAAKTLAVDGPKMPSEFKAFIGPLSEGWFALVRWSWACLCCMSCNCCICICCWCSLAFICCAYLQQNRDSHSVRLRKKEVHCKLRNPKLPLGMLLQLQNAFHLSSRWIYPKRQTTTQRETLQEHQLLHHNSQVKLILMMDPLGKQTNGGKQLKKYHTDACDLGMGRHLSHISSSHTRSFTPYQGLRSLQDSIF